MLSPESEKSPTRYEIETFTPDSIDKSYVFFQAANAIGFNVHFEVNRNGEGEEVARTAFVYSDEELANVSNLGTGFIQTPIGAIIDAVGNGNYEPLLTQVSIPQISSPSEIYLQQLPQDLKQRVFLKAYERDRELRMKSARHLSDEAIRMKLVTSKVNKRANDYYLKLKAEGQTPLTDEELLQLAIEGVTSVANLLRIKPANL
jgi:hypothetical protein